MAPAVRRLGNVNIRNFVVFVLASLDFISTFQMMMDRGTARELNLRENGQCITVGETSRSRTLQIRRKHGTEYGGSNYIYIYVYDVLYI